MTSVPCLSKACFTVPSLTVVLFWKLKTGSGVVFVFHLTKDRSSTCWCYNVIIMTMHSLFKTFVLNLTLATQSTFFILNILKLCFQRISAQLVIENPRLVHESSVQKILLKQAMHILSQGVSIENYKHMCINTRENSSVDTK